jgi:hypothetical protein
MAREIVLDVGVWGRIWADGRGARAGGPALTNSDCDLVLVHVFGFLLSFWNKESFLYYYARLWEGGALRQFLESIVTTRAFSRLEHRPHLNTANMCGAAVYFWQRYLVQWLGYSSFARTSKDVA